MRTFRLFNLMRSIGSSASSHLREPQIKRGSIISAHSHRAASFSRLRPRWSERSSCGPASTTSAAMILIRTVLYFQMQHVLAAVQQRHRSRQVLEDVEYSIRFIEGRDEEMAQALVQKMNNLSMDTKFEEAEIVRRRLRQDPSRKAGNTKTLSFPSGISITLCCWLRTLSRDARSRSFARAASSFRRIEVDLLAEKLNSDLHRLFDGPPERDSTAATTMNSVWSRFHRRSPTECGPSAGTRTSRICRHWSWNTSAAQAEAETGELTDARLICGGTTFRFRVFRWMPRTRAALVDFHRFS